ncbi:DNA internalization-related competence protein ComEC/Rec2 [Haloglycomyces albus]|uniref:DNA internalization-related competence protein ComEC/Rec2 n=1 Tax=Haloglycomyces albus TaxID=526067 RepID=UPI0004B9241E|nr:DNA internalization-related competence protein ComEC/Rec2 [Haloglycomyces albus]
MNRPRRDVRIILVAVGVWTSAALVVLNDVRAAYLLLGVAVILWLLHFVAARLWQRRRRLTVLSIVATMSFGGLFGALASAVHVVNRDDPDLVTVIDGNEPVTATVEVRSRPRQSQWQESTYLFNGLLRAIAIDDTELHGAWRIRLIGKGSEWAQITYRRQMVVEGSIWRGEATGLTAAVMRVGGVVERDPAPAYHRWAHSVRERTQDAVDAVSPPESGLIPALAIGDRTALDDELSDVFRETGLVHLTVTSGYHVGIVTGAVFVILLCLRIGVGGRVVACVVALLAFNLIVGPAPSVLRASVMAGMALLALAIGRPRAAPQALAAAVVLLVLFDPALALDPGFCLSVAATMGLLVWAFDWARRLRLRGWPTPVALALTVAASTQVAVTPILAGWGEGVSWVSVPVNLVAAVAAAPAVLLSILVAVIASISVDYGAMVAEVAAVPVRFLVWLAETGSAVPHGTFPWPRGWGGAVLVSVIVAVVWLVAKTRRRRVVFTVMTLMMLGAVLLVVVRPATPESWVVTMCDVGQGDAFVVPGDEGAIVIDAGPHPAAMDACLNDLGVDAVELFIVSHFHMDHVGGAAALNRGREVRAMLVPPAAGAEQGYELVGKHLPTPIRYRAQPGETHRYGATTVEVLGPPKVEWSGTRSDANNNSTVVRIEVDGTRLLFPGDVELAAQERLWRRKVDLSADIVKVPHHGSAYQSDEFLDRTGASTALIGVGAGNRHGHPDRSVIRRLESLGMTLWRSDRHGQVNLTTS